MPSKVVGYSGKYLKSSCPNCNHDKMEIVQTQSYIGISKMRLFGIGPREFSKMCINCQYFEPLNKNQIKKAEKLKYAKNSEPSSELTLSENSGTRYYPVLNEDRREEIRKNNMKEGLISMVIGVIIGIILINVPNGLVFVIGIVVILYSIIGGLYAALEDPERKHRDLLDGKKTLL